MRPRNSKTSGLQADGGFFAPLFEMRFQSGDEAGKLRVAVDQRLDLGGRGAECGVAGTGRLEEGGAEFGADVPVVVKGIDVAVGDAAEEVAADVLDVLGLLGVDVAGQVEIEVVFLDLIQRDEAGVAGVLLGIGEDIDDLVQVALAEAVLVAVLDEALERQTIREPRAARR